MATLNASTFPRRVDAEQHYLTLIDALAAQARYIDPAQAEVYREKLAQAQAGGGPLLEAESAALGANAETVRKAVLRNHDQRQQHVNAVELARIKAKADVRNAATTADMHRIYHELEDAL